MCGIAGVISPYPLCKEDTELFLSLMEKSALRGDKGIGVATQTDIHRWPGFSFAEVIPRIREILNGGPKTSFLLGHIRASTVGGTDKITQPRVSAGFGTKVLVAHNGILLDWLKAKDRIPFSDHVKIDTDIIGDYIQNAFVTELKPVSNQIAKAVERLKGSFACWVRVKDPDVSPHEQIYLFRSISTLYARRNIADRMTIFASSPGVYQGVTLTQADLLEEGVVYDWRLEKVVMFPTYSPYKI